jgi:hypothetical protein
MRDSLTQGLSRDANIKKTPLPVNIPIASLVEILRLRHWQPAKRIFLRLLLSRPRPSEPARVFHANPARPR